MKSKNRTMTAFILCDRCIRALRSRGEKIYVSDVMDHESFNVCMWCNSPDDELFKVVFEPYGDFDAENDD